MRKYLEPISQSMAYLNRVLSILHQQFLLLLKKEIADKQLLQNKL